MKKDKKWMQKAVNPKEKGELHKKLKVPTDEKIPTALLKKKKKELQNKAKGDRKLSKTDKELLGQIQFALNARKAKLLSDMIKIAGQLDAMGLYTEADGVDNALEEITKTATMSTIKSGEWPVELADWRGTRPPLPEWYHSLPEEAFGDLWKDEINFAKKTVTEHGALVILGKLDKSNLYGIFEMSSYPLDPQGGIDFENIKFYYKASTNIYDARNIEDELASGLTSPFSTKNPDNKSGSFAENEDEPIEISNDEIEEISPSNFNIKQKSVV